MKSCSNGASPIVLGPAQDLKGEDISMFAWLEEGTSLPPLTIHGFHPRHPPPSLYAVLLCGFREHAHEIDIKRHFHKSVDKQIYKERFCIVVLTPTVNLSLSGRSTLAEFSKLKPNFLELKYATLSVRCCVVASWRPFCWGLVKLVPMVADLKPFAGSKLKDRIRPKNWCKK